MGFLHRHSHGLPPIPLEEWGRSEMGREVVLGRADSRARRQRAESEHSLPTLCGFIGVPLSLCLLISEMGAAISPTALLEHHAHEDKRYIRKGFETPNGQHPERASPMLLFSTGQVSRRQRLQSTGPSQPAALLSGLCSVRYVFIIRICCQHLKNRTFHVKIQISGLS